MASQLFNTVLWSNPGTAALTGIVDNGVAWFKNFTPGSGVLVANGSVAATEWQFVDTKGADDVVLQFSSKITTLGGLGTAASGIFAICAIGVAHYDSSNTFRPYSTTLAPSSFVQAGGNADRGVLFCSSGEAGTTTTSTRNAGTSGAAFNDIAHAGTALVPNIALTVGDTNLVTITLGKRPFGTSSTINTLSATAEGLKMTGLAGFWIAIAMFQDYTAITGSPAINAEWRAIGYGDPRR